MSLFVITLIIYIYIYICKHEYKVLRCDVSYDSDEWVSLFKVRLIHYGCGFWTMDYFAS